ncbi:MAG: precorrin-6y C5,15-methyltransferase (decarboxylating) subunit CbiE [Nitrososphaerales archaeon]
MTKVYVIGVGPGSPDYVTPIARKIVQNADLIVGAKRALNLFLGDIKGEVLFLTSENVSKAIKYAIESAKIGKIVAVLSTGDPCFAGLLRPVLNNIKDDVKVEVIPGISSIQICAARLNICWDETDLFSFHEGVSHEKKERLVEAVKRERSIILLPDPKSFPPNEIAKFLINNGINEETMVSICENLTLPNERIFMGTLKRILNLDFSPLCVMVVRGCHQSKKI